MHQKHFDFETKNCEKVARLDGFIRSRRVQILPNYKQKKILQLWFHEATAIYNQLVAQFTQIYNKARELIPAPIAVPKKNVDNKNADNKNADNKNADNKNADNRQKRIDFIKLIEENENLPIDFEKLRSIKIKEYTRDYTMPYCVIADIIKEFVTNVKGNITKMHQYDLDDFVFKIRKFDRCYQSLPLEKRYTYSAGFYKSILGNMKSKDKTFNWSNIEHDYKLIYDKYKNKYYVHVPKYVYKKIVDNNRKPIVSLDPGERTFQTLYALDHVVSIGENMRDTISKRLLKIDKLKTKIETKGTYKYNKRLDKYTRIKRRRYKKAIKRHHDKIDDLVKELHYKTAIFMCESYDRIIVTDFSSKKVSKKDGNLNPMSKRVLGKLSHYKFRQRLSNKCEEYGCQYFVKDEMYTTKTCCCCGNVNHEFGSDKIYGCVKCESIMDRDVNAAINIFIKHHKLVLE